MRQKIVTHLWFDNQAEEAVAQYMGLFKDSEILQVSRYGDSGAVVSGMPKGSVLTIRFRLEGQEFLALNGGPVFAFNPAVSLLVDCSDQGEVDRLWEGLSEGGSKGQCGWLTDRFGLSWQVVPSILGEMLGDPDEERVEAVMAALLKMEKLEIGGLEEAYRSVRFIDPAI